jgi:uracil-DNA glycosylase
MDIEKDIESSWKNRLNEEFKKPYFLELKNFLLSEGASATIFPPPNELFSAFEFTPFDKVKVVILGQDPYHGLGQAHGLCFSVRHGVRIPPSLSNIYKEIKEDIGIPIHTSGDLSKWAKQGVLLLNATLTVRENQAGSHQNKGWESFTDAAIKRLSEERKNLVFLLWGKFAQNKEKLISKSGGHLILKAAHPSFFSVKNFYGCRHFSKTNEFLKSKGIEPIDWDPRE